MPPNYVLLVSSGKLRREIAVGEEPVVVGRGPTAKVRLPDDYCSREHGKFTNRNGELFVEDLGARNGIFVNGERVLLDVQLSDGDEIRMGRTVITVRKTSGVPAPVVPSTGDLSDTSTKDLGPEGIQFVDPAMELGFSLTKLVAVSGMGLLFEAQDVKNGDKVAFKILRPDRATEANVARAVEEAKSLSRIHHDNIVRIMSTGRMMNGESFLVMDYIEGLTATQLGKAGRLWIPEALKIGSDMCSALEVIHQRGMVHRDIKPSNVMVENESHRTVLIDFSLALTEAGGLASAPAGTIIFCAPEQVQPHPGQDAMHPAVDIYGLGGTLYFMLVGAHPFRGSSTLEIQQKKLEGPLPVVKDRLKARATPDLDEIVHHCLQPQPESRPESVRQIKRAIDKARMRYPKAAFSEANRLAAPAPVRKRR
ncbi:MAG: protein kinase domain-containing protein [Planctomycetota bacterium]|jgi:serine/threonine protein kinase